MTHRTNRTCSTPSSIHPPPASCQATVNKEVSATMNRHPASQRHCTFMATIVATITAGTLLSGCSGSSEAAPCVAAVQGGRQAAIVLLADGRSPALSAAATNLAGHPDQAFSSPQLGFAPPGSHKTPKPGVVVLTTYDSRGNLTTRGTYDLAGIGNDDRVRERSRRRQAWCLIEAVAALPEPRAPAGDLLRTLGRASAVAIEQAGAGHSAAVVAVGLGRSTIDGRPVAELDLGPAGQAKVFAELDRVGMVPDLSSAGVTVRMLDPSDGVASSVSAAGVESFATSLCSRIAANHCSTGPGLTDDGAS